MKLFYLFILYYILLYLLYLLYYIFIILFYLLFYLVILFMFLRLTFGAGKPIVVLLPGGD